MKKLNKNEILVYIVYVVQIVSIFTLSTLLGKIVYITSLIFGLILAFYNYKKNIISKERFVLLLILSGALLLSFVPQILSVYFDNRTFGFLARTIRRLTIIGIGIYMYVKNN